MSRLMTKPTKWHASTAKTQISLDIHQVWSESSLSAWRQLGSLATHWAHSEDSDQTGRMPRLIWVFAGRTCHFVGFVMRWLKYALRWRRIDFNDSEFSHLSCAETRRLLFSRKIVLVCFCLACKQDIYWTVFFFRASAFTGAKLASRVPVVIGRFAPW